jgi:hypothetical protein
MGIHPVLEEKNKTPARGSFTMHTLTSGEELLNG